MGKVKYAAGIDWVKGSLSKPVVKNGHSCGTYLIGTHREAENPQCRHVRSSDRTLCERDGSTRQIRNRICCGSSARQRPLEDGCRQSGVRRAEGYPGRTYHHEELPLETRTGSLRPSAGLTPKAKKRKIALIRAIFSFLFAYMQKL